MASSEGIGGGQVLKRYQLFVAENFEDKIVKKAKGADIAADEAAKLEPKFKLSSIISSQGIAVVNDVWFVLGTVKASEPETAEEQHMLLVCTKGATISAIRCHEKSFGIWARETDNGRFIVTVGEDLVDEAAIPGAKKGSGPSGKKVASVVIKIWDADKLVDNKYRTLEDYDKEDKSEKVIPKIVYLDRIVPIQHVTSVSVSKNLTHIAIGLATGFVIFIGPPEKLAMTLYHLPDKDVQYINLSPEAGYDLPVTNIHLLEFVDKGKSTWLVFCTCEKAFYLHHVANRKGNFSLITNGFGVLPGEMDACGDDITLITSDGEMRKYKATNLEDKWPMKESGRIRILGKQIMVIQASDKNKTIRVYDMDNEIISYQAVVADVLADQASGNTIYLLLKGPNSRTTQTLREKPNVDKLEAFLKKRHYDVAYKFAKNEKFSEEVLADISRYYGDFFHSKGMYKEAVEKYINTIGYLNPSYVIQKFLDVQRLENLTIYLEALSKQSQERETMLEEHKYYTALLLNCYVKQGGNKLKDLIISTSFDKSMLDTDTAIEVCKESKQLECAMLLAEKAGNVDQQLRILIEDFKRYKEALDIISKNMPVEDKPKYLRRFGPQLIKELPNETYEEIENVAEQLISKRTADTANAAKYSQQFKMLKEIFVDNKDLNKRFLDFQVTKDPNSEKEVFHSLIEWHLQDYYNAKKQEKETKLEEGAKIPEDQSIETKKKTILNLLTCYKEKYDKKHVLMLFEMYQVSEGVSLLCEMLELKNELMTYYMQNKDYDNIVKLCERYGESDQNLWVQALTYFVGESAGEPGRLDSQKYVKSVLSHIEKVPSISPLMVLQIISRNKALKFSMLKNYLSGRLKKLHGNIDKNRKAVSQLAEEIDKTKQNITTLRTSAQLFQLKECAECGKKLELPIFHFMCNHSFHDYCVSSEAEIKECPKCCVQAQQILDKKQQLVGQAENHEQFFKELKEGDKKFDVVAQYFGRGLFTGFEHIPAKYVEEKKE